MTELSVRSRFVVPDGTEVWEGELAAWFAEHPADRGDLLSQEGTIVAAIDGQEGRVTDQIVNLIGMLCFGSIGDVVDKGEMIFNLETAQTTVRLRALGEEVELASNVCDPVLFPRRSFLEALVACGERFIALAETLWSGDPDNIEIFTALKASATAARAKLTAAFGTG